MQAFIHVSVMDLRVWLNCFYLEYAPRAIRTLPYHYWQSPLASRMRIAGKVFRFAAS